MQKNILERGNSRSLGSTWRPFVRQHRSNLVKEKKLFIQREYRIARSEFEQDFHQVAGTLGNLEHTKMQMESSS